MRLERDGGLADEEDERKYKGKTGPISRDANMGILDE